MLSSRVAATTLLMSAIASLACITLSVSSLDMGAAEDPYVLPAHPCPHRNPDSRVVEMLFSFIFNSTHLLYFIILHSLRNAWKMLPWYPPHYTAAMLSAPETIDIDGVLNDTAWNVRMNMHT